MVGESVLRQDLPGVVEIRLIVFDGCDVAIDHAFEAIGAGERGETTRGFNDMAGASIGDGLGKMEQEVRARRPTPGWGEGGCWLDLREERSERLGLPPEDFLLPLLVLQRLGDAF